MFCAVFWNIEKKTPRDGIVRLVTGLQRQEDADVVALAECPDGVIGSVLRALNPTGHDEWEWLPTRSRVRFLFRGDRMRVTEAAWHEYYSQFRVRRSRQLELLVVVAHMPSRVRKEFDDIDEELGELAHTIRTTEETLGHTNTIILGDMNANPFANGMVLARSLHGVMSRAVAEERVRHVSHRVWPYFFNPMWQFFGDGTTAPPGTCYYSPEGSHRAFHWNMFDQVLLRPDLLPHYQSDSVRIIDRIDGTALTGPNWIPDRSVGSDHLPVRIRLSC